MTKITPGINVKIPAADRIEILATKTLATLVIIAPIGLANVTVSALDNKENDYSMNQIGFGYTISKKTGKRIGFITPLSHNFCELCNRVRAQNF